MALYHLQVARPNPLTYEQYLHYNLYIAFVLGCFDTVHNSNVPISPQLDIAQICYCTLIQYSMTLFFHQILHAPKE